MRILQLKAPFRNGALTLQNTQEEIQDEQDCFAIFVKAESRSL